MFAGIDTHKDTLAVAVVDARAVQVAAVEVANTAVGFAQVAQLLAAHRVVRVGIEGCQRRLKSEQVSTAEN